MPTLKDAVDQLRHALVLGWFSSDVREHIRIILDFIDKGSPPLPPSTQTYALEPGKHYVMAYDTAAVSTCMVKALSENLETAGIHVFMVGVRGNPKDAIAFAPTNQTSQATDKEPRRPSVKDTRDAATRIRRGYAEGWFSPDVRTDIGVILYYVEGCLPKQPKEAV